MKKIILASGSPRRQELLRMLNIPFEVSVSSVDETTDISSPDERVKHLALIKARAVAENCENDSLIIGSDTVVAFNGKILNKPADDDDARYMLHTLSGNTHQVFTGLAIITKDSDGGVCETAYADCTEVMMNQISDDEIENYIASKECRDKAGAYAIQGKSSVFIKGINGDYYTVMGLPVRLVYKALKENGIDITEFWK